MSKRFARCGVSARSKTHSSTIAFLKPYDAASTTLARTQPLVTQPVWITVSTRFSIRKLTRLVPKNALAADLAITNSPEQGSELIDNGCSQPWRTHRVRIFVTVAVCDGEIHRACQCQEGGDVRDRLPGHLAAAVGILRDRIEDRLVHVASEVVFDVDDQQRRPLTQAKPLLIPGSPVDFQLGFTDEPGPGWHVRLPT